MQNSKKKKKKKKQHKKKQDPFIKQVAHLTLQKSVN